MGPTTRQVLVLEDPQEDPSFDAKLDAVLNRMNCQAEIVHKWKHALEKLENSSTLYDLLIIDPHLHEFEALSLQSLLTRIDLEERPRVALISFGSAKGFWLVGEQLAEEQLDACVTIEREHSAAQLAFLLNRCWHNDAENKRKNPRALAQCDVQYYQYRKRTREYGKTFTLSIGGMFLQCDEPKPKRSFLRLKMALNGMKMPVHCSGRVVFNNAKKTTPTDLQPSGMGVRFLDMTFEDQRRIYNFIYDRIPRIDQRICEVEPTHYA